MRLAQIAVICLAPQYVAEELLRAEGFTDIRYVDAGDLAPDARRSGAARSDFSTDFAHRIQSRRSMPAAPITVLAGVHVGCFELFAQRRHPQHHRSEGQECRRAARVEPHLFAAIDGGPCRARSRKDIHWVTDRPPSSHRAVRRGQDRRVSRAFRPSRRSLRARNIGHVIVNTAVDRPWSQYFCCMLAGNREYVRKSSGGDQARAARHPQGSRPLRHRAGAGRATARRWRLHRRATIMRCRR